MSEKDRRREACNYGLLAVAYGLLWGMVALFWATLRVQVGRILKLVRTSKPTSTQENTALLRQGSSKPSS